MVEGKTTTFVVPMEDTAAEHVRATLGTNYLQLHMLNGEQIEITTHDFFDAFQILTCSNFQTICMCHNMLVLARATAEKRMKEALEDFSAESLECYGIAMARVGKWAERIKAAREEIVAIMGWNAWVNACRLYECLYRIPREEL